MIFVQPEPWDTAVERLRSLLGTVPTCEQLPQLRQAAVDQGRAINARVLHDTAAALDRALAGGDLDALRTFAGELGEGLHITEPIRELLANAYNPSQPRIPKGHSRGGQWSRLAPLPNNAHKFGLNPNALGKTFEGHRVAALADLAAASALTVDPESALTNLRAQLKVKKPVKAADVIGSISGATAAEAARIHDQVQSLLDMMPPRVVKKLPRFNVVVSNRPAWNCYGSFHQGSMQLELNRAAGGVTESVVWHETMHWVHNNGPKSYKARVQEHYRRRTAGERLQNSRHIEQHRRDQFPEGYMGRSYIHRPDDGCEIPSMNVEYMSADRLGAAHGQRNGLSLNGRVAVDMKGLFRPGAHQDTAVVAMSIFYYGRRKKKGGRP